MGVKARHASSAGSYGQGVSAPGSFAKEFSMKIILWIVGIIFLVGLLVVG